MGISTLPDPNFPIGLLQMSIKVTNEAPAGMKAGVKGSYHWVTQDLLDAIPRAEWRHILYIQCFMHSVLSSGGSSVRSAGPSRTSSTSPT